MHPTAGGRRRRRQHSTQGKPAEGRGSPAGLRPEPRGEQKNGRESELGFNSFLPLSVCVNTSFQSRALNRNSGDGGEHYEAHRIPSRKNPVGCMYALSHTSTIQLLPAALAHLSLSLSEHRATPRCCHLILIALTSTKENPMTRFKTFSDQNNSSEENYT